MKLTDRTIRSLGRRGTGQYEVFDDTVPGLAIRVNSRSKSWVLFYRERLPDTSGGFAPGKRLRRLTLGTYPALGLATARTKAQLALRELNTKGTDPAVGKREARNTQSFGELAADYMERHAKPRKKSWKEDQRKLNADVLPHWAHRHVKAITRRDVHDLLDRVVDRGKPVMANRVQAVVSRVFKYGIDRGWLDSSPAAGISKQPETSRERVLTHAELTELWRVLEAVRTGTGVTDDHRASPLSPMLARGLQMMLRTASRGGEIFSMRWDDVDETKEWWTIPGAQAKNGVPHRVPLTTAALALIAEARADGSGPSGWVFAGPRGGTLKDKARKVVSSLRHAGLLTGDYTRHDFRRTVATSMVGMGITTSTIAKLMNHVEAGPRAT
ncbi:MAG: tyrosine-type recombinase/integrase, partial [bacterium]